MKLNDKNAITAKAAAHPSHCQHSRSEGLIGTGGILTSGDTEEVSQIWISALNQGALSDFFPFAII